MTETCEPATEFDNLSEEQVYRIKVKGRLDSDYWSQWFDGMTVRAERHGETVIYGPVADQAALYGLLSRIRDLGLPLLLVKLEEPKRVKDSSNEGLVIEQ